MQEEIDKDFFEEEENPCVICKNESEFLQEIVFSNGIKQIFFFCESCYNKIKRHELKKENNEEFWLCVNGNTPEDYRQNLEYEQEYKFPFEVTQWKDGAYRIVIK